MLVRVMEMAVMCVCRWGRPSKWLKFRTKSLLISSIPEKAITEEYEEGNGGGWGMAQVEREDHQCKNWSSLDSLSLDFTPKSGQCHSQKATPFTDLTHTCILIGLPQFQIDLLPSVMSQQSFFINIVCSNRISNVTLRPLSSLSVMIFEGPFHSKFPQ